MCILDLFVLCWGLAFVKLLNRAYNEFQNLRNTHFSQPFLLSLNLNKITPN